MIEAPIPQDILKYKAKFISNFSARQAVGLGLGIGLGAFAAFGIFNNIESMQIRTFASLIFAFPPMAFGFIQPFGQPLEKIGWIMLQDNLINPPTRYKEIHYDNFEKWKKTNDDSLLTDTKENTKNKKKSQTEKKKIEQNKEYIGRK